MNKKNVDEIFESAELCGLTLKEGQAKLLARIMPASRLIFGIIRKRRLAKIDSQLTDVLALLGNALKSGLSLVQAIDMASRHIPEPAGRELKIVSGQTRLGRTVEEAMQIFETRVPTEDAALISQSIAVLRKTGGNLIETFSILSSTVEDRRRVEQKIGVLTAQGIYQGIMLTLMPWFLGIILYIIAPDYIEPLFKEPIGWAFIGLCIILEIAGGLWLKKIVMIKV